MNLTVVAHPYVFFIRNAKVYPCERPSIAPFQLSHILRILTVGSSSIDMVEIASD